VAGMEIILIRHGQPAWSDGTVAFNDPGLTDLGHAQAERMAERVADMGAVDHFLVSPMVRARETARPLAERLGQEPLVPAVAARDRAAPRLGRRPDRPHRDRLPGVPSTRPRGVVGTGRPGRRTVRAVPSPGVRGLDTYLARLRVEPHRRDPEAVWHIPEDAGRLVIVAHAGTNSAILGRLLGIEPRPWEWERFHSVHASVTILSTTEIGPGWIFALDRFSGTGHLAGLDITH
jgi:broad specificity phosphatase PhoE